METSPTGGPVEELLTRVLLVGYVSYLIFFGI